MHRGKEICNELKAVRRRIAEENGIPLEIPECPHKGPCPGTCPRCESELRQLENALADRLRLGKVATVAGIALALATPALAQTDIPIIVEAPQIEVHSARTHKYTVRGTVVDAKTREPIPFLTVTASEGKKVICMARTDFDGAFTMELSRGNYTLRATFVGYTPVEQKLKITGNPADTIFVEMMSMPAAMTGLTEVEIVGITSERTPIIEMGDGTTNNEQEGVRVRVQY